MRSWTYSWFQVVNTLQCWPGATAVVMSFSDTILWSCMFLKLFFYTKLLIHMTSKCLTSEIFTYTEGSTTFATFIFIRPSFLLLRGWSSKQYPATYQVVRFKVVITDDPLLKAEGNIIPKPETPHSELSLLKSYFQLSSPPRPTYQDKGRNYRAQVDMKDEGVVHVTLS